METAVFDRSAGRRELPSVDRGAVNSQSELELEWRDGRFLGRNWLLGNVYATLRRESERGVVPSGVVRSAGRAQDEFFPAYSENRLWFMFRIPRFGLELTHDKPVVNAAVVETIPPYGVPFPLEQPVVLRARRWRWLKMRIADCVVKTLAEEGIQAEIEDIRRDGRDVVVVVTVQSQASVGEVLAVWSLTVVSGETREHDIGHVTVTSRPQRLTIRLSGLAVSGDCAVCFRVGTTPDQQSAAASAPAVFSA